MSHLDPLVAIPVGLVFAVAGVFLLVDPEQFLGFHGWPRTLERFLGRRVAVVVLRVSGGFLTVVTTWLVIHEATTILS